MLTGSITISEYSFLVIYSVCFAYFLGKQGSKNKKTDKIVTLTYFVQNLIIQYATTIVKINFQNQLSTSLHFTEHKNINYWQSY